MRAAFEGFRKLNHCTCFIVFSEIKSDLEARQKTSCHRVSSQHGYRAKSAASYPRGQNRPRQQPKPPGYSMHIKYIILMTFEPPCGKTNNVVSEQVLQTNLHKHRKELKA